MPDLREEGIRAEILAGRLSLLSIDTNVFDRYNDGLEHGLLKRLSQFKDTEIKFVLSDIILRELKKHMIDAATSAVAKFTTALKAMGGSWNISTERRDNATQAILEGKTPEASIVERTMAYQESTGLEMVEVAALVDIGELIDRYFETKPPFAEKDSKKHEFPDALALMSLERYAAEATSMMLVVSEDKGWFEFCTASEWLVCIDDLSTAMSYFQRLPLVVAARLSERLLAGEVAHLVDFIHDRLNGFVDGADFEIEASASYFYEDEIEEKIVSDVLYDEDPIFTLIEQKEDLFVFETTVIVTLQVTCNFYFSVRDSIDRDYVGLGSATETLAVELPFSLTVTIEGDPLGDFDVSEVEVIQFDNLVDFGNVEPDFSDPDL